MSIKSKKAEAPKPLGAAPQWTQVTDVKAMRKKLIEMASKIEKDPKKRKAFVAQGMAAIDHAEAKTKVREQFGKLVDEIKVLFDRHGVKSFNLVANIGVDDKTKALGVSGWATSQHVGGHELELIGMLAKSLHQLNSSIPTSRF